MRPSARAATHPGRVRAANEDSHLAGDRVFLVADGMGGHACGDVASRLAVDAFRDLGSREPLLADQVVEAVAAAHAAILAESAAYPEKAGMGTTLSGLALVDHGGDPHWLVVNVGDSRVYRVTDAGIVQLTVDHSEVAELVAAGRLTVEEARRHPLRNVVTRSLGTGVAPVADTWLVPADAGDRFLVCSDGLVEELTDEEIFAALTTAGPDAEAAVRLVDRAVEAGGRDNVTVLLVTLAAAPAGGDSRTATAPRSPIRDGGR